MFIIPRRTTWRERWAFRTMNRKHKNGLLGSIIIGISVIVSGFILLQILNMVTFHYLYIHSPPILFRETNIAFILYICGVLMIYLIGPLIMIIGTIIIAYYHYLHKPDNLKYIDERLKKHLNKE